MAVECEGLRHDSVRADFENVTRRLAEREDAREVRAAGLGARGGVSAQVVRVVAHTERVFDAHPTDGARSRALKKLAREVDEAGAVAREHPLVPGRAERVNPHA